MSEENQSFNHIVWCDIPVANFKRACDFYSKMLKVDMEIMKFDEMDIAVFYHEKGNGACLVPHNGYQGASDGPLVYFNVDGRLKEAVNLVSSLGGKVVEDTHSIGEYGFRAIILDSEGNRLALHSMT